MRTFVKKSGARILAGSKFTRTSMSGKESKESSKQEEQVR